MHEFVSKGFINRDGGWFGPRQHLLSWVCDRVRRTSLCRLFAQLLSKALAVILGVATAFVSGAMGHFNKIPGAADPAEACLFSLFDVALFAAFVWAGFLYRSNSEVHSRLMVLSMAVPLLPSAIGRMCNFKPGIATPIIFAFMLAGPIYDFLICRKIHPAYLVGLVVIVVTGPPLRLALGKTALWHHLFARAVGAPG